MFISSLTDRPRICPRPRIGLLGHRPSPLNLNSTFGVNWPSQYPLKILLFDSSGENEDFDIPRPIPPYGLVWSSQITTIHVYSPKARPWRFSDQSVLLFNFGNSLVPHVQRLDGNQTVGKLSWNTSGKSPAHNFCATINTLSNQFLFSFNIHIILDPVHWTCLFLSLSLSCASTNTKILSEDHFSHL